MRKPTQKLFVSAKSMTQIKYVEDKKRMTKIQVASPRNLGCVFYCITQENRTIMK